MDDTKRHPVDTAVGVVLGLAGIALGVFLLYVLTAFAVLATSDW